MIDLDNTLADRDGAVAAWLDEFCADYGLDESAKRWIIEADNDGYADRPTVFAAIRERFGLGPSAESLVADYRRRVVELARPTEGAVDCLIELRAAGATIAIVSNGTSGQQHGKIETLGLKPLVDAVIISGDLEIKKPDRRIFEAAALACGLDLVTLDGRPGWMVGDSPLHDIVGGRDVGLRTAWLHRGRTWDAAVAPPDLTIGTLSELPMLVLGDRG